MPTVHVDGCDIAYEVSGSGPPMLMPIGLGGVIVGSSTGGAIAQQMALDHADHIRSIAIVARL